MRSGMSFAVPKRSGLRLTPSRGFVPTPAIDLLPTLTDLAGIAGVGTKPLDGVSLKPLLLGTAKDMPDRMILSHWAGKYSVRSQRYRLDDANRLFDMEADPGQERDVSKDRPEEAARL